MGGGSSKVDNYVLRVENGGKDDKVKFNSQSKSKSKNDKIPLQKGKSVAKLDDKHGSSEKAPMSRGLSKRASNATIVDTTESTPPNLGKLANSRKQSSAKIQTQQSAKALVRADSINVGGAVHGSIKHPWLMKNANLNSAQLSDFEMGRVIGRGLMGTVRVAKYKNGKYLVLKAMRKDFIVKHNDHRHIRNEKELLMKMNSPFCIKLFGTMQDKSNVYLALEFCPGGELFHRLGKKERFSPQAAKFYISEVFVALEHVQSLGYVYRDLKPENVVLDEDGHCKLIDFGFATPCQDGMKMHTLCGTPQYLSPEQLDGKFTNGYTRVVDWWSFGVLVYELLTGKTPFSKGGKESHYEIFLRILNKRISFPWGFDSEAKELISRLCHAHLDKRLCQPEDIKRHPYFEMPWEQVRARMLVPPFVPRIKDEGDVHYFDSFPEGKTSKKNSKEEDNYGHFDF